MKSINNIIVFILCLSFNFLAFKIVCAEEKILTRAEGAALFASELGLQKRNNDPKDLYGFFENEFPGGHDGIKSLSFYDKPLTLEVLTVVLVRTAGWSVTNVKESDIKFVENYVSPEGFPYWGIFPTKRSIPYIVKAIKYGLLDKNDLKNLLKGLTKKESIAFIKKFKTIQENEKPVSAFLNSNDHDKIQKDNQIIIISPGEKKGSEIFSKFPDNPVLDLRGPNPRLIEGGGSLSNGLQDYFPLGALQTTFTSALNIPSSALYHQGQGLYSLVENSSSTVNGVGIWGAGVARAKGAQVWGGFLTAETPSGEDKDAQVVGLEIDITNKSKQGIAPNNSKVGLQIAGLGTAENSDAIEILAADKGQWNNGLLFGENSMSINGALIASSIKGNVGRGIDFSATKFKDYGMQLGNNTPINFISKKGSPSSIYADNINDGSLVIRSGPGGIRFVNNSNSKNLFVINNDGSLDSNVISSIPKKYSILVKIIFGIQLLMFLIILKIFYVLKFKNNSSKK
jgi:hypothetical protein